MTDDEFWQVEDGFWTRGRDHYERWFSPHCVAGFPKPAGIMEGNGFVADLPEAGGWHGVEMSERVVSRPTSNVTVLAYLGLGRRDAETYRCICTSTYVLVDETWQMVQHQQTPVGDAA